MLPGNSTQFPFKTSHHAILKKRGLGNVGNSMHGTGPCLTSVLLAFLFKVS